MSRPRLTDTILVADDELYNLSWLVEYLEAKKYKVVQRDSVIGAIESLHAAMFRMVIADLSIPDGGHHGHKIGHDDLQNRYPGLAIAHYARTFGHLNRQVVVYSVHDDAAVRAIADRIRCTYLLKGRPRPFKVELDSVLSRDPLARGPKLKSSRKVQRQG